MAHFLVEPFTFFGLRDKVVVLTGGANGIGAATVTLLYENGARVFFGDIDVIAGTTLESSFPDRVHFVRTNVTHYSSILDLFKRAYTHSHRIDHAFAIAGISEQSTWFHPELTIDAIETCPEPHTINIDLVGVLYFARIAAVYMHQDPVGEWNEVQKSLVLVSSIAGFTESPGLPLYCTAKHGVIGLMRSLRTMLPSTHQISVSAVCPWMVLTNMVEDISNTWQRAGLAVNSASDVANIILGLAATAAESNGKAIYVEGGRGWDIEEGLNRTQGEWMGKEQTLAWQRGQALLSSDSEFATFWPTLKPSANQNKIN